MNQPFSTYECTKSATPDIQQSILARIQETLAQLDLRALLASKRPSKYFPFGPMRKTFRISYLFPHYVIPSNTAIFHLHTWTQHLGFLPNDYNYLRSLSGMRISAKAISVSWNMVGEGENILGMSGLLF